MVLIYLPELKSLDFGPVTNRDRDDANTWQVCTVHDSDDDDDIYSMALSSSENEQNHCIIIYLFGLFGDAAAKSMNIGAVYLIPRTTSPKPSPSYVTSGDISTRPEFVFELSVIIVQYQLYYIPTLTLPPWVVIRSV